MRPFVYALILLFTTCALFGLEWWPFTGWRLFSHVRSATSASFVAVSLDRSGHEHPLDPGIQPEMRPYARFVTRYSAYDPARQRALCETWARVAGRTGDVQGVRIYRVERAVPRRGERRGTEVHRSRVLSCKKPT